MRAPGPARLAAITGGVLLAALLVAPFVFHNYDVVDCFLPWARASLGRQPWGVYAPGAGADDCDYPPVVPYLLTLVEAARLGLGGAEVGRLSVLLVKLPGLLAQIALAPLAFVGLADLLGRQRAAVVASLLVLSPALFVNTALWGQFDVLLAFLLLAALLALLHDRPLLAGAVLGAAFATKLLAVVVFPPVAVWIARRHRARQLLLATAAGILVALLFAAPHAVHGRGAAVLKAYTGAVNYYPFRTAEAYNGWYVLDRFDQRVRALGPEARRDDRPALGPVTWRHLGLGAFAAFTLAVLAALARRPEPNVLVWTCVLQAFGFFMLPTQVHQRYVVPAALLATLLVPFSRRGVWLFAGLTLTATLNQGIDLARALPWREVVPGALTTADLGLATRTARDLGALVGLLNLALFAFACWAFAREVRGAPASTVSRPPQ